MCLRRPLLAAKNGLGGPLLAAKIGLGGPLLAAKIGLGWDHFWQGGTTFGCQNWSPVPRDQFWLPKVVRGTTFGRDHFWHDRPHQNGDPSLFSRVKWGPGVPILHGKMGTPHGNQGPHSSIACRRPDLLRFHL